MTTTEIKSPYLTLSEAAKYCRMDTRTLFKFRAKGIGPRQCQVTKRILFHIDDLDKWLRVEANAS